MKGFCGECDRRYACDIDPDKCDEWPDPVTMTNADRIRAMSDEEMAEKLGRGPGCPVTGDCEKMSMDCNACWLDWLQQTAEEDNDD